MTRQTVTGRDAPRGLDSASLGFALTLLLALGLRLAGLGSVPTVFFCDECDNAVFAVRVLEGKGPGLYGLDWKPQPALAVHLMALSCAVAGPSLTSLRLPSALLGALSLLPFFLLARRACTGLPAVLATGLLALHPAYLHFSRSGWENIQICFWGLLAMEAVARAETRQQPIHWIGAGICAGIGALTYFAGRAIAIYLGLEALALVLFSRGRRRAALAGLAGLCGGFALIVGPLLPTVLDNWELFQRRPSKLFIGNFLPAEAGLPELAAAVAAKAASSLEMLGMRALEHTPRYFPTDRRLLDPATGALALLGLAASLRARAPTRLWWLALFVPFLLTQALTVDAPNLARGIGLLPVVYLFVALGMSTLLAMLGRHRRWGQAAMLALAAVLGADGASHYFRWAQSPALAAALQPAVEREDFGLWWKFQQASVRAGDRFCTVDCWNGHRRAALESGGGTRQSEVETGP